jgi:hypothetical protein
VTSCKVASCKVASCKVASCKVASWMGIKFLITVVLDKKYVYFNKVFMAQLFLL